MNWNKLTTDELLVAMPENWFIRKDSGCWIISSDEDDSFNPGQAYEELRPLLIEFLKWFDFFDNDMTLARLALRMLRTHKIEQN